MTSTPTADSSSSPTAHCLLSTASLVVTVDVEDWPQSTWDHNLDITERCVRNTEVVLEALSRHRKKATMFVLGKLAEKFPRLVERIAADGHEVASHGYGHVEVFKQSCKEFRDDVVRAKGILEAITGQAVLGYRAPDFSVVRQTIWALDELADAGYRYDSSIFPIRHARYGIEDWPTEPILVTTRSGAEIAELPPATIRMFKRTWPVAGGGYHRLFPWSVISRAVSSRVRRGKPFVAYCHPYEFDPYEFRSLDLPIPLHTRLHQGLGRKGFQEKFERLLAQFDTATASEIGMAIRSRRSEPSRVCLNE